MSILRYSFIVDDFYRIKLPREKLALIDAHFLAASHHFFRSECDDLTFSRLHSELFWRHLVSLMKVIREGDFSMAFDNTLRGLDRPQGWDTDQRFKGNLKAGQNLFPDPEMFKDMLPDIRYPLGDPHPYDALLEQPKMRVSQIQLEAGTA